jgi:hypothetical protein
MKLPDAIITQVQNLANRWISIFDQEKNALYKGDGSGWPTCTPIIRLDCTVTKDGELNLYEVEERPSGVGITGETNPDFRLRLAELRKKWNFPGLSSLAPEGYGTDDRLWLPTLTYDEALRKDDGLLLVRYNPRDLEHSGFYRFAHRAISTLEKEGDKKYLPKLDGKSIILGLKPEDKDKDLQFLENLPLGDGWAMKPGQGSRTYGIKVVEPGDEKGFRDLKKEVRKRIREGQPTILQPYSPPMMMEINGEKYNAMLRLFLGYNPRTKKFEYMHGLFCAVPIDAKKATIIHGRADAIFGRVV